MMLSSALRHYHINKLLIFIIVAASAAVFLINSIITSSSSSSSSLSVAAAASSHRLMTVQRTNDSAVVLHSLSATFVRVDAAAVGRADAAPAHIVLAVDAAELTDFMDAYRLAIHVLKDHSIV